MNLKIVPSHAANHAINDLAAAFPGNKTTPIAKVRFQCEKKQSQRQRVSQFKPSAMSSTTS